jgi:hypothetical protein
MKPWLSVPSLVLLPVYAGLSRNLSDMEVCAEMIIQRTPHAIEAVAARTVLIHGAAERLSVPQIFF